ncbi:MAG: transporter [Bacteroidales bacterium]|nr:transporter [Bacteroidales bacterium]MCL2133220.1 transporter [Bacteroidales bacterium]
MLKFIKNWILPIAIITGALMHKWVIQLSFLTPYLLFIMLLLTFCKISFKDIRFHSAHIWLLLIQLIGSITLYYALLPFGAVIAQGAMLCVLMPTATAAAIVTGLLGGSVGFLTAYALFCNLAVAVAAPVYFSLTGLSEALSFTQSVWYMSQKIFPILVLPLLLALVLRYLTPKIHKAILAVPQLTFYLWIVALIIVMGNITVELLHPNSSDYGIVAGLIIISLFLCCIQFLVGRRIGKHYGDTISAGQGLGQKNTILAIWMAHNYLHPLTAIAPAGYILWQNIINSYQLYRKRKKDVVNSV